MEIRGRMILNWDRYWERKWARSWSGNIWHCKRGFKLKRGYRVEGYRFPYLVGWRRKILGWGRWPKRGLLEPPRGFGEAKVRHKGIWMKMHERRVRKAVPSERKRRELLMARPKKQFKPKKPFIKARPKRKIIKRS
jgi:hypothetical protein